ncbi:MAG: phosphodiester glycosidase family protein, partial [Carboxydocellales bacterium]
KILIALDAGDALNTAEGTKLALGQITDNRIELRPITGKHYQGYLLLIHNPKMVRVITTKDLSVAGEKTSDIAKRVGAVAAINGGGFLDPNGKGNGGFPQGITIHQNKVITGLGTTEAQEIIGFDKDGVLTIGNFTLNDLQRQGVGETVSFGPQLIKNGLPMVKGNGGWGIAPRTAIAQKQDGTVIFLTIDGRQLASVGATLKEVQNILLEEGAYNAANLDGGSSTTMFYQGQVINTPANPFGERYVPTAFVVMPK